MHDARPPLRIIPRLPHRDALRPFGHRRSVSSEAGRDHDPLITDLHHERIPEDPELVIARQDLLSDNSLHPVDPIKSPPGLLMIFAVSILVPFTS